MNSRNVGLIRMGCSGIIRLLTSHNSTLFSPSSRSISINPQIPEHYPKLSLSCMLVKNSSPLYPVFQLCELSRVPRGGTPRLEKIAGKTWCFWYWAKSNSS